MERTWPNRGGKTPGTPTERFWEKVERTDGCWYWGGARMPNGYGMLTVGGRNITAHRFSMTLVIGRPLRKGELVCHRCDNPPCVRPEHLFLGTAIDNTADMLSKGRASQPPHRRGKDHWKRQRTHCPNGHEWTPENTRQLSNRRECITCRRASQRRYKERMRAR